MRTGTLRWVTRQTLSLPLTAMLVKPTDLTALKAYSAARISPLVLGSSAARTLLSVSLSLSLFPLSLSLLAVQ